LQVALLVEPTWKESVSEVGCLSSRITRYLTSTPENLGISGPHLHFPAASVPSVPPMDAELKRVDGWPPPMSNLGCRGLLGVAAVER
jgi:hypothetical protein